MVVLNVLLSSNIKKQNEVEWYIDRISVAQVLENSIDKETVFPVHRWLRANKPLIIDEFDTCLPQHDPNQEQRENEIARKRLIYTYKKQQHDLPPQVSLRELPGFRKTFFCEMGFQRLGLKNI